MDIVKIKALHHAACVHADGSRKANGTCVLHMQGKNMNADVAVETHLQAELQFLHACGLDHGLCLQLGSNVCDIDYKRGLAHDFERVRIRVIETLGL